MYCLLISRKFSGFNKAQRMSGGRLKSVPPVLRQSHPFGCPLRAIGSRDILDIIPRMPCTCSSVALPGVGVLCSRPQLWGCTAVFLSCSEQALQLGSATCAELYFHPLLLVPSDAGTPFMSCIRWPPDKLPQHRPQSPSLRGQVSLPYHGAFNLL